MNDISAVDLLKYFDEIDSLFLVVRVTYLFSPTIKLLLQLVLQNLHHLLQSVFVKRMGTGLPLRFPNRIAFAKEERFSEKLREDTLKVACLIKDGAFVDEEILDHGWIRDVQVAYRSIVDNDDWVFS